MIVMMPTPGVAIATARSSTPSPSKSATAWWNAPRYPGNGVKYCPVGYTTPFSTPYCVTTPLRPPTSTVTGVGPADPLDAVFHPRSRSAAASSAVNPSRWP